MCPGLLSGFTLIAVYIVQRFRSSAKMTGAPLSLHLEGQRDKVERLHWVVCDAHACPALDCRLCLTTVF